MTVVTSESTRGVLLGTFIPPKLAAEFQQVARERNDPPSDAIVHALQLYVLANLSTDEG